MPDKNTSPFMGGASLLRRAIIEGLSLHGSTVIVSTDIERVDTVDSSVILAKRPPRLATDTASMWSVLSDLAYKFEWDDHDVVVLFQPSSLPLRNDTPRYMRVRDTLAKMDGVKGHRTACSAWKVPERWHPAYCMDPDAVWPQSPPKARQGLPVLYRPNGLFYILDGRTAREEWFWQSRPMFVECNCHNIDTMDDWKFAEADYA